MAAHARQEEMTVCSARAATSPAMTSGTENRLTFQENPSGSASAPEHSHTAHLPTYMKKKVPAALDSAVDPHSRRKRAQSAHQGGRGSAGLRGLQYMQRSAVLERNLHRAHTACP